MPLMVLLVSLIALDFFFFFKDYFSCAVENDWRESRVGVGDQSGSCYFSLGRK